jgi:hypothetical protein
MENTFITTQNTLLSESSHTDEKNYDPNEDTDCSSTESESDPNDKKYRNKVRHIYMNELDKEGRFVAITFTYIHNENMQQTKIKYGASIYRKEDKKRDILKRKKLMETATERFNKYPVDFHIDYKNNSPLKFNEITKKIRKMMMKAGCCCKNI